MSPIHFVSYNSSWLLTFEPIWGSVKCLTPSKELEWRMLCKPKWEAMIGSPGCVSKGSRWTQGRRWRQRRAGPHKYQQSQKVPENIKCAWKSLDSIQTSPCLYLWRFVVDNLIATIFWISLIAFAALCFALVPWTTHCDLWYCGWATAGVQTKAATTQKGDALLRTWCHLTQPYNSQMVEECWLNWQWTMRQYAYWENG